MAVAHLKTVFLSPGGKVPVEEMVSAMGHEATSPEIDPAVVAALG